MARPLRRTARPAQHAAGGRRARPSKAGWTGIALVVALLLAVVGAGCGSGVEVPPPLSARTIDAALSTTPAGLTPAASRLERRANTVLPGDGDTAKSQFDDTVRRLRGQPVVVNLWGEWCGPCKRELPVFQRAALALRGKAVFLGVETRSGSRGAPEAFLRDQIALPYPSVFDPDEQVNGSITGVSNIPKTLFYGPGGGKPFVHIGPYESVEKLVSDVGRYAR